MQTQLLTTSSRNELAVAIERASGLLAGGEVVALPTETVYGLATDATRPDAVVKIFEAKERPFFDPLIVHLPSFKWLERVAEIPDISRTLVEMLIARFWPGPLTLVLPRRELVPDIVTAGLSTVAVRMSAHPVFRAVIEQFGKPLAAPSANRFGRISPTTSAHVMSELSGRIPLIVDGGPTEHGLESTIVKVEPRTLRVLRAGPVTLEDLRAVGCEVRIAEKAARPEAPGQLQSHYAPRTRLLLGGTRSCASPSSPEKWDAHERVPPRAGLLAWREVPAGQESCAVEVLSPTGDLHEAAATLFAKLRRLDEAGLDFIFAEPVPEHGLGIAIMDRLRKAAAAHG